MIGAFFVSLIRHEGLHGIGFVLGGTTWADVGFGVTWKTFVPYAHCTVPLRAGPYRWALVLPGLVLGFVSAMVGLIGGVWSITLYAFLVIYGAGGDAMMLWILRNHPSATWVLDHPSQMGCLVLGHASSPARPTLTADLEETLTSASETESDDNTLVILGILGLVAVGVGLDLL